jgi:hypothetical protein
MIIQGDHGTRVKLLVNDNYTPVELSGAEVELNISQGSRLIKKTAQVTGLGECEVILTSEDTKAADVYSCQATVFFGDGTIFSSDIQQFVVIEKLNGRIESSTFQPIVDPLSISIDGGEF